MANKQGTNQIVNAFIGDKLIEARYIGQTKYFDAYTEVTGALPLSFNARVAGALKNYRMYGDSDGSGVQTENLLNWDNMQDNMHLDYTTGKPVTQSGRIASINPISVDGYNNVTVKYTTSKARVRFMYTLFDSNDNLLGRTIEGVSEQVIYTGLAAYMYISWYDSSGSAPVTTTTVEDAMIVEGSTAPTAYIPFGYKIPISLESGGQQSNYDLFIGDSKLGAEEYVDYQEQKVYKRTENLWNPNTPFTEGKYIANSGGLGTDIGWRASDYVNVDSNKQYTFYVNTTAAPAACHAFYNSNKQFISSINSGTQAFITPNNAAYARFSYRTFTAYIMLVEGSTVPQSYIPYLQPTDPPVPLPAIQTYQGENTLSSTETVGEVSVKGRIAPMYRQVEYLKSTGTQYIDTDIIPTYSTKTELDIKFSDIVVSADNDHSYIFGISGASALGVYNALLSRRTSNDVEDIGVYDGFYHAAGGVSLLENLSVKTRNILTINRPTSSWGSTTVSTDKTITAATPTAGLCIFGLKGISGGQQVFLTQTFRHMFLYECKIYLNGSTLSNDLIPVERYDGVLGLYDKITAKFYMNTGTGEFVKGEYV